MAPLSSFREPEIYPSGEPAPTILHALDADTGQIVAAALTTNDVDDGSQVGPLLDQVTTSVVSFTADGAYDQEGVAAAVAARHPEAAVIVPPRSTAVPSETAATAPTQRDHYLQCIAEHGRAAWQKASGYTTRARVEATGCRPCSEPHAGAWTPGVRPHRMTPERGK